MIWKDTTNVGCAYAPVENFKRRIHKYFVVCRYSPPGNWKGEFKDNVLKPTNTTVEA